MNRYPGKAGDHPVPVVDASVPHPARVYDYLLGGKDNFEADRALARQMMEVTPDIASGARANREFLARAVRYLAGEARIRQFLDVGTGIPAAGNTHEVAQAVAPDARVVYVDRDPIVLVHARALLTSGPQGACAYLDADANDPQTVLALAADTLDFSQPIAVTLLAVLHVLEDQYAVVRSFMSAVPSGSYLALTIAASDIDAERQGVLAAQLKETVPSLPTTFRSRPEVERFFDGLELVEPGITTLNRWRPAPGTSQGEIAAYAAVARKP